MKVTMTDMIMRWGPSLLYAGLGFICGVSIFEDDGLLPRIALPICVYLFICSLSR